MSAPSLFDPIQLGAIAAPNRIIMAPLTRGRAGPSFVPNELAREHYRQRASAGLIISEATGISQEGIGWPSTPGLWTEEQVEGWKPSRTATGFTTMADASHCRSSTARSPSSRRSTGPRSGLGPR